MIHEIIVEIQDEDFHKYGLEGCREVVRCNDCKLRYTVWCGMFDSDSEAEWTEDNGFCQYGERKESCTQEQ